MGGIFGNTQAAPSYASGLSMAARPGGNAAVAAPASDTSEFESENCGLDESGDSDGLDVQRPLETTQGRSGGSPSQAKWANPNDDPEVMGTQPRGVCETRTWDWKPTQGRLNLSNAQEKLRRERVGNILTEAGFDNVPDAEEEPKPLGNCSFGFYSFGEFAQKGQKMADEWTQMRKAPVTIMAVCEATNDLQDFLRSPDEKLPHPNTPKIQRNRPF